MNMPD
jgi:predicted alpha/beta hydrolase